MLVLSRKFDVPILRGEILEADHAEPVSADSQPSKKPEPCEPKDGSDGRGSRMTRFK